MCIKFEDLALIVGEKSVVGVHEKIGKNGQRWEMISWGMLNLSYTIQQLKPNACTNVRNPKSNSS